MNRAYAKINTVLDVTGIREDGYHEVKMIMQETGLFDTVILEKGEITAREPQITLSLYGASPDVPSDERNIAVKAARLMAKVYNIKEDIHIELTKRIPSQAGLGGGSADAAAVMREINAVFGLNASPEELSALSVKLGADVPFCVLGGACLSEGIGERLTPVKPLPSMPLLLIKPPRGISTKTVYTDLDAIFEKVKHPDVEACIKDTEKGDLEALREHTGNVLSEVTERYLPEITEIKGFLYKNGAKLAMMSGSGSTVFGIFDDDSICREAFNSACRKYSDYEIVKTVLKK